MVNNKLDFLNIVLQPYVIDILNMLRISPHRFKDLKKYIKNPRTLSLKLIKLRKYNLIDVLPTKVDGKYVNSYKISKKGKDVLNAIKRIHI